MIRLIKQGNYQLLETKKQTKILILDKQQIFAWIDAAGIGEILITSHKTHITDTILALGRYYYYEVRGEPGLTDTFHLELETGQHTWQDYLLIRGLPNEYSKRNRIIPTRQTIVPPDPDHDKERD